MMDTAQRFHTGAAIYGCLQQLYTYPIRRDTIMTLLELENTDSCLWDHLAFLRRACEKNVDSDQFLEKLDIEFTRLFVGPGRNPTPPYASFYLNGASLMGPEVQAVRGIYLDWGMVPVELDRVPDDHISLEFSFMEYLNGETYTTLMDKDDQSSQALYNAQADFLHDRLLTWVPHFCSEVIAATQGDFFIGLSQLTQAHLENDAELLSELVTTKTMAMSASNT